MDFWSVDYKVQVIQSNGKLKHLNRSAVGWTVEGPARLWNCGQVIRMHRNKPVPQLLLSALPVYSLFCLITSSAQPKRKM